MDRVRYRFILLDLDGTLISSLEDLAEAGNHACRVLEWPTHTREEYRHMVGNGQRVLVQRMAPVDGINKADLQRAYDIFCDYYAQHEFDHTRPYPGILRALDCMRQIGIAMGVLTNKNADAAHAIVRRLLGDRLPIVQGRTDGVPPKPNPAMTRALMTRLNADPASTLMVGDSDVDIQCGKNVGIDTCGVLWGFRDKEELVAAGATHLAQSPAQLVNIVCG